MNFVNCVDNTRPVSRSIVDPHPRPSTTPSSDIGCYHQKHRPLRGNQYRRREKLRPLRRNQHHPNTTVRRGDHQQRKNQYRPNTTVRRGNQYRRREKHRHPRRRIYPTSRLQSSNHLRGNFLPRPNKMFTCWFTTSRGRRSTSSRSTRLENCFNGYRHNQGKRRNGTTSTCFRRTVGSRTRSMAACSQSMM